MGDIGRGGLIRSVRRVADCLNFYRAARVLDGVTN
jgi:hypothetical protein